MRAYNKAHPHAVNNMPSGDYLKGRYSKRTKTVMRLLRDGHLSQTKIAKKVGVSKQRVWAINKSYVKHLPEAA
jgi:DNA-directed RNA polymerase specialized sigma subunit